jgi:hypothetical protein
MEQEAAGPDDSAALHLIRNPRFQNPAATLIDGFYFRLVYLDAAKPLLCLNRKESS